MIKLLVDTSGKEIGIGLFENKKCLFEEYKSADKTYNKKIIPLINQAIKEGKVNIADIDLFGATMGPGSFTGIRIGISVMKALCQVLDKKFYGVPVPDILAKSAGIHGEIVVLMDAGRREFYFTRYNFDIKNNARNYALLDENTAINSIKKSDAIVYLQNDAIVKDFVENHFKRNKIIAPSHIDIKVFSDIIDTNDININEQKMYYLSPVYVRQPDAEKNLKRRKSE